MKKVFLHLLLALSAILCLALFGACSSNNEHDWSEWTYVEGQAPDCTHGGLEKRVCRDCGEEEQRAVEALGHDWSEYSNIGDGKHERLCKRENCGFSEQEECEFESEVKAPTCQTGGYTEHRCKLCNFSYRDGETETAGHSYVNWKYAGTDENGRRIHTAECEFGCGQTETENCQHDSVIVSSECEKAGYTSHTCEKCGDTFKDGETLPLEHIWGSYEHAEKKGKHYHARTCLICLKSEALQECNLTPKTTDPTCESAGYTEYTCETCGNVFTGNQTKQLNHDWSAWAHYEEDGVHYRKCNRKNCSATESAKCEYETLVTHPTCDDGGYTAYTCKECKNTYKDNFTEPAGHEWGAYEHNQNSNTHFRRCLNNPEHKSSSEDCIFTVQTTDPTCEENGKIIHSCNFCDNSYEETGENATGHSFENQWHYAGENENGKDYHKKSCTVCGKETTEECKIVPSSKAPTCTEPEKEIELCSECLHTDEAVGDEPALGHKYGEWQRGTKPDGTHYHYHVCENNQEHREEFDCVFGVHTTDPTCTSAGVATYTCTECAYSYNEDYGEPTGHIWNGWKIDSGMETHSHECKACGTTASDNCQLRQLSVTPATCSERGYTTYICDICNDTYNKDYSEAKGHDWENPTHAGIIDGKRQHVSICRHDNSHKKYEECTDSEPIVTAPTCQLAGYTTYNCDKCGAEYTDNPTPANGQHNWGNWEQIYSILAYETNYCCHRHTCTNEGCTASETFGCDFVKESKEATCLDAGYSYLKCSTCQKESQRINIPALGHDFGGYNHIEEEGAHKHTRTCLRDECGFEEKEPCIFVSSEKAPTCNYTGSTTTVCERCLYSETVEKEKLEHTWGNWKQNSDGNHSRTCSACSASDEGECHYDVQVFEATCTERGYTKSVCRECSNIKITYSDGGYGHKWTEIKITDGNHSAKCSECGENISGSHDYSESNFCSVCKHDGLAYMADPTDTYYIVYHDRNVRNAKIIEIPEIHDGKPVKEISSKIFNYQTGGFYNNKNVEEVTLPENLEVIAESAFAYCTNLKTVKVRNDGGNDYHPSLKSIESFAFRGCTKLKTAENLPDTLKSIGDYAFFDCNSLSDIKLAEGLEFIGAHAFDGTAYFTDINHWTNGVALYIGKHLISVNKDVKDVFEILDGTLTIGVEAFKDCKSVTKVVLPKELIHIDADAFLNCTALKEAEFKGDFGGWTKIHFVNDYSSPLAYADKLHIDQAHDEITIPDGVTAIPANTFRNTHIKTIHIPASVTKIGDNAFADCDQLATVTVAEGSKLAEIGKDVFKGSLYYNTPANWEDGVLYLKDSSNEKYFAVVAGEKANGAVNIKDGTQVIADYAFYNLTGITSVVTPDSIVRIGEYAFNGCTNLTEATIGSACKKIAEHAFTGCSQLESATFKNAAKWLYRRVGQPIYRGIDTELLSDKSKAASYIKDENLFEISKL